MRILILSPYISDNNEHKKNKTGFGIMVMSIVDSLCDRGSEVFVLTHALCRGRTDGLRVILKHSLSEVLLHAQIRGICAQISELRKLPCPFGTKLRMLYYYLDKGFIKRAIQRIKPDIVHVHGLGLGSKNYIDACEELEVPFVVTAHGLIQNDQDASQEDREFEREFFRHSEKNGVHITVVSTGIKRRLCGDYYGLADAGTIHVVTNGTDLHMIKPTGNIRSRYGIPPTYKICLVVGSVCERKNQIQIVRAYSRLPQSLRENTRILILGSISENDPVKEEISRLGLNNSVICCGFVQHEELCSYYADADLNILASRDEGFGLPVIEGFVYGLPCVTFSDLDAVPDIYDENAVELCYDRTDESFAKAITAALERQWDKEAIKLYSKKFSLEAMAERYMDVYAQVINSLIFNK